MRRDSGMLRSRITFTTVSSIMLADTSTRIAMRSPPTFNPVRYWRSPLPTNPLMRVPGWPGLGVPALRRRVPSSSDFRSCLSRSMASRLRQRVLLRVGQLLLQPLGFLDDARRESLGWHRFVGALERIAQHDEVLVALEHFLLDAVDLRLQVVVALLALLARLRAQDGVEQHDGAEPARDHVEERKAEYLGLTPRHRRPPRARARARRPGCRCAAGRRRAARPGRRPARR